VSIVVSIIPFFEIILAPLLDIVLLVLFFMGVANATKGVEKELPLVGHFARDLKFYF